MKLEEGVRFNRVPNFPVIWFRILCPLTLIASGKQLKLTFEQEGSSSLNHRAEERYIDVRLTFHWHFWEIQLLTKSKRRTEPLTTSPDCSHLHMLFPTLHISLPPFLSPSLMTTFLPSRFPSHSPLWSQHLELLGSHCAFILFIFTAFPIFC